VPTASPPLTGEEFITAAAKQMKGSDKYSIISKGMMFIAGMFNRTIRESMEMVYQSQFPYVFDSSKFQKAFNFQPTSYQDGIKQTAEWTLEQHV
jgi:nucleoside-diphosphate-sugar epimerase